MPATEYSLNRNARIITTAGQPDPVVMVFGARILGVRELGDRLNLGGVSGHVADFSTDGEIHEVKLFAIAATSKQAMKDELCRLLDRTWNATRQEKETAWRDRDPE